MGSNGLYRNGLSSWGLAVSVAVWRGSNGVQGNVVVLVSLGL